MNGLFENPTTIIAIAAGLLALGIWLGSLRTSNRSAHARIDKLESLLASELRQFRHELREDRKELAHAVGEAWKNCPLARSEHGKET